LYSKLQTRFLVREDALIAKRRNCQTKEEEQDKIWSRIPKRGPIPRLTGRLTVGRKKNSNSSPGWYMSMGRSVECELAGQTEVLGGGGLPQFHLVHHKSHKTWLGIESEQLPELEHGHNFLAYFPLRKRRSYEATVTYHISVPSFDF
jgi:hypothetical protein